MPLAKTSPPPTRNPLTLSSLPQEILSLIARCLTRSDAVSLSQTSRNFIQTTETFIWQHLDLRIDPLFGQCPLPSRGDAVDEQKYKELLKKAQEESYVRYCRELRDKVQRVMLRAGERRLGLVKGVTILPRPGNLHGLIHLLHTLSPHLTVLEIEDAPDPHWDADHILYFNTLDHSAIGAGLSFPALTRITLRDFSVSYTGFITLLVQASPNLNILDIGHHHFRSSVQVVPSFPSFPSLHHTTQIKYLSMSFNDFDNQIDERSAAAIAAPLFQVLERSPKVHQLRVHCYDWEDETQERLLRILSKHKCVRDLYWTAEPDNLSELCSSIGRLTSVRRLAVHPSKWYAVFSPPVGFPTMESFYVIRSHLKRAAWPSFTEAPTSTSAYPMTTSFAIGIRESPRLRIIHILDVASHDGDFGMFERMDEIEAAGTSRGRVRSYRHGEHELLHAALMLEFSEVSDDIRVEEPPTWPWASGLFPYTAKDGSRRQKVFEKMSDFTWYHYTDYDGMMVPLEILEEMRRVEGLSEAEWDARGVQVGDEAWKVLMDWREGQLRQSDGA